MDPRRSWLSGCFLGRSSSPLPPPPTCTQDHRPPHDPVVGRVAYATASYHTVSSAQWPPKHVLVLCIARASEAMCVVVCIVVSQITALPHGMACQCARYFPTYSVRPCVPHFAWPNGAAISGWGGVATETCNPPNQWMAVDFEKRDDIIGMACGAGPKALCTPHLPHET